MPRAPHVGLWLTMFSINGIETFKGIAEYAHTHGPWAIWTRPQTVFARLPEDLQGWPGEGLIIYSATHGAEPALAKWTGPFVNYSTDGAAKGYPSVITDNAAIGRMAAEHLLSRGFRQFGYCASGAQQFSEQRREAFEATLREHGHTSATFVLHRGYGEPILSDPQFDQLCAWLAEQPKPLGLMAAHDLAAMDVLAACKRMRIAVPEQVAVLGVDNDEMMCLFADPPLTSIDPGVRRVGYQAAALLDRLMQGEAPPAAPVLVPPLGVITRQSTDVLAITDPEVAEALVYIRQNASRAVTVEEVLREVPVNRRSLERRFRQTLGRTPADEIRRARIERVQRLLADTDLRMDQIAEKLGFANANHMAIVFRRQTGLTPRAYRRQSRRTA